MPTLRQTNIIIESEVEFKSNIEPPMTQSNEPSIEQMNEVIARFMGGDYDGRKYWKFPDGRTIIHSNEYNSQMKYHTSWDWLMPVLEKIHALAVAGDAINAITSEEIFAFSIFAPLKDVHKAVYLFIIWYNQQTTPNAQTH